MNLLYLGGYKKRFNNIIKFIDIENTKKILELAFGDIYIAQWARSLDIDWVGIDVNESFVLNAKLNGYNACLKDLSQIEEFPFNDLTIIAGSLYHFHQSIEGFITKIMNNTNVLLISEPIKNISSNKNLIGKIASNAANVNKGKEDFRYNEKSIIETLATICNDRFNIQILGYFKKDIIIKISR
jgi:hypothetical protein